MGNHMERTKKKLHFQVINLPFYYWFGTQGRFLDHVCSCQCHHIDFAIDPLQLRSAHEHCSHLPESKGQTGTRQTKTLHLLKWLLFSFDCLVLMCLLCNAKEKVSHLSFLSSDKKKKKCLSSLSVPVHG